MKKKHLLNVRPYRAEDKKVVLNLCSLCWEEDKRRQVRLYWEWLHYDNPNAQGTGPVVYILERDGEVAGTVSCIPTRLMVKGVVHRLHWITDFMVSPTHRGWLTGLRLANELHSLAPQYMFAGFPLKNTLSIWTRAARGIGLDIVGDMKLVVRPLHALYMMQNKTRNPVLAGLADLVVRPMLAIHETILARKAPRATDLHFQKVDSFDERVTEFFFRVGPTYPIIVVRDAEYLNWRYTDPPGRPYQKYIVVNDTGEMKGYVVISWAEKKNGVRDGLLVDFLAERGDEATVHFMIRRAVRELRRANCAVVKARAFSMPDMAAYLRRLGFYLHPEHCQFMVFYNAVDQGLSKDFVSDPTNWYITRNFADEELNEFQWR